MKNLLSMSMVTGEASDDVKKTNIICIFKEGKKEELGK